MYIYDKGIEYHFMVLTSACVCSGNAGCILYYVVCICAYVHACSVYQILPVMVHGMGMMDYVLG